ncbi:hypothetical protein HF086_004577 [Spodoptera exigua]|uniref:Peptidase S1 domain-containing protein n=1 Tax=Spodoptera exigua TaxID=7107 RepID=A0A922MRA9_SPOEX|nr:hypothetical protein HF086_004577 [Spodoptera exigua]
MFSLTLVPVFVLVLLNPASPFNFGIPNVPTVEDILYGPVLFDNRIVGGQNATIENHPYQVSFVVNNSYFCGGFIVSENYILTAAHCAQNVDPSTVVLRAGSTWRRNGTIIPIAEVIAHPEYDNPAFDKDVAQGSNTIPENLMDVEIPVVPYWQCLAVYFTVLTRNMWCGGNFVLGGKGTCQGDSGGTAVQNGKAVGIVSFGRGCGQQFSPSVFADTAAPTIRDFITKHTGL